jgi:tRNA(fMet)-specific endonuclease VapC
VTYVLDTNAVSALMKGVPAMIDRLAGVSRANVVVPQPVLAEIAYGISRLPRSKRRTMLQERFDRIRSELARIAWSDAVSDSFGSIKADLEKNGRRIEDFDAAIAAHASAIEATLVTANIEQMSRVDGLAVEDWSK